MLSGESMEAGEENDVCTFDKDPTIGKFEKIMNDYLKESSLQLRIKQPTNQSNGSSDFHSKTPSF